jgi:hypothetical protein
MNLDDPVAVAGVRFLMVQGVQRPATRVWRLVLVRNRIEELKASVPVH